MANSESDGSASARGPFVAYADEFYDVLGDGPRLVKVVETDAHEGPVYLRQEDALYFTTLPTPTDIPSPGFRRVAIKRLALNGDQFPVNQANVSVALASLATLEGPIIMMSQRRQIKQDRLRADNDYRVNLKAELEVRYLDEKMDRLFAQQRQLMHTQIEILERLIGQSQVLTKARGAQYGIRNTEHTSRTE